MSCNTDEEVRVILKYSTIAGTEPTIPASGDHEDGTWLPTDLYVGELFMNSVDEKLWIRTDNGIVGIGGTAGATFSGIYDYVHISGGTYSGEVYAPTFSSIGIVAQNIYGDIFQGNAGASASFIGSFFGDGSGLTGLICEWLGGTVSAPVHFTDRVDFTNDIYIDGAIYSNNPTIAINSSLEVSGGVSASIFYGDGSGLTNLPTGTYSDTYTSTAALTGNTILFTRNDASDYSVDLTPILATQGVVMVQWDDTTDVLSLYMNDGSQLGITIDTFAQVNSTGTINAPEFYGGTFYGSFVGDITGVIGATGPAGATGAAGATGPAGPGATLEQTLKVGNTTGTQSIYIGSSASIIEGYNGVRHHWYDASNPLGDYYRIENGTGASSSFIQMNDDTSGRILIQNNNAFDNTSSESSYARINIGVDAIQNSTYYKDNVSGTTWYGSTHDTTASGTDAITRDYIADTTGWVATSTTGVYLQGARNGGLSASDITITPETITSRTENDGYSWTQIEQRSNAITISGDSEYFRGLEYDNDYSSDYTDYSLVSRKYVNDAFVATNITYTNLITELAGNVLKKGTTYFISDKNIWLEALDTNLLSTTGKKWQVIVKPDVYITNGTWASTNTYAIGDKAVWGGKVWNNLTGAVGSKTDWSMGIYRSLDATNWVEVPNSNATYYIGKIFDVDYELATDIIWAQRDDKENSITWDINGDNTPYQYEVTDWGSPLVYGNRNVKVITNNYAQVNDNENIYGYITENTGQIGHNKNINEYIKGNSGNIFNNNCNRKGSIGFNTNTVDSNETNGIDSNTGNIYGNIINGSINGNTSDIISANTNNGDIANNLGGGHITQNSNNGSIFGNDIPGNISSNINDGYIASNISANMAIVQNSNNGNIVGNTNNGDIVQNSNNGHIINNSIDSQIFLNSNDGYISNNSGNDYIYFNSNTGAIFDNNGGAVETNSNNGSIYSNSGTVQSNSNNGSIFSNLCSISMNTNNGTIYGNTINGSIERNTNNGNIESNTQTSGTTNIIYNNNNGAIGGARTGDVIGTVVNI